VQARGCRCWRLPVARPEAASRGLLTERQAGPGGTVAEETRPSDEWSCGAVQLAASLLDGQSEAAGGAPARALPLVGWLERTELNEMS
jgi:hypothetical protein